MDREIRPLCPEKNATSERNPSERSAWLRNALHAESGWSGSRTSVHSCHSPDRTGLHRWVSICSESLRYGLPHVCDSKSGWEVLLHARGHGIPKAAHWLGHVPELEADIDVCTPVRPPIPG